MLHHIELWVTDLSQSKQSLGWLFQRLGYECDSTWARGASYRKHGTYIVLESGPDVLPATHERRLPGLNHLAFSAGTRQQINELTQEALAHGFSLLFADQHPFAGGENHYAAYLQDAAGFEIELVAVEDHAT